VSLVRVSSFVVLEEGSRRRAKNKKNHLSENQNPGRRSEI
jgi:hypothetical protein